MAGWSDGYWSSDDGLRLHYRDYPGKSSRPPILCIPGLTRNARDFEGVAERLAGEWRLICVELRGRGESAHARDAATYAPSFYVEDVERLIAGLGLERFIVFGTSLGGLVALLLALRDKSRFAGLLLNDVGPVLDERGLHRIRSYVGRSQSWPTWIHAARHFQESQAVVFPKWTIEQWLIFAKRLCKLSANGRIVSDYDPRIADAFKQDGGEKPDFDLWPAVRAIADMPGLVVRGELSDLLTAETVEAMTATGGMLQSVTIPDVGHAPTLEEPEAVAAIDALLARIETTPGS